MWSGVRYNRLAPTKVVGIILLLPVEARRVGEQEPVDVAEPGRLENLVIHQGAWGEATDVLSLDSLNATNAGGEVEDVMDDHHLTGKVEEVFS
jgi:hypothetical protein